jgi:thiol:disulfide interchange protein DsbA
MMRTLKALLSLAAAAVLLFSPVAASALTLGKDYRLLNPPQPAPAGEKVEVLEFFWYGCPHCYRLQGPLEDWLKHDKPDYVEYKRVPAAFNQAWLQLARVYYTLDAMNLVDKLHQDVFIAIHKEGVLDPRALLRNPNSLFDWVAGKGVDRQKFVDTYDSFTVKARTQRTLELTRNYDVQGTPTIVVDGRYITAPSMILKPDNTIDYPRYFQVLDEVIALARKNHAVKK